MPPHGAAAAAPPAPAPPRDHHRDTHQWSTGRRGVGVTSRYKQEGERGHAIPQDERGDMRERADGVRLLVSGGADYSIRRGVDGGIGSGIRS